MIQCGHRLMATNNNALQGNTKTWCCRIGESSESRAEHWAVVTPQKLCDCMHGHANLWPQNIKKVHMHNTGSVSWANWSSLAQNKNCKWFIGLEIKGGDSPHCCLDSTLQSSPRIGSSLNVTLSIYGCTVIHMVKCTHACYHQLRANHKHESQWLAVQYKIQVPSCTTVCVAGATKTASNQIHRTNYSVAPRHHTVSRCTMRSRRVQNRQLLDSCCGSG